MKVTEVANGAWAKKFSVDLISVRMAFARVRFLPVCYTAFMAISRVRIFTRWSWSMWLVTALLSQSTGCFHFRTDIPGVLDLRSDASLAQPLEQTPTVDESLQREGAKETLQGQGITFDGHRVLVHERVTWLGLTFLAPGAFLLWNGDGAVPELEAALGERGILRNVQLSHRLGFPDLALDVAMKFGQLFCPPLLVLAPIGPPMSMWASGERVLPVLNPEAADPESDPPNDEVEEIPAPLGATPPQDSSTAPTPATPVPAANPEEGPISL